MICEEVVSILEIRLHEDLNAILRNELSFESSDNSTDQRVILFQSILTEVMHFDDYLRATWGISNTPNSLLIHCYLEEEVFSFWRSVDSTLYQGFVEGLSGDTEGNRKLQVVLNTILNKYNHIVGEDEQKKYYVEVIAPLFSIYLSNIRLTTNLSRSTITSIKWGLVQQYVNSISGFLDVLNDVLERNELVPLFESESELEGKLMEVKEKANQEKKVVLYNLINIAVLYYSDLVFDSVILTELFTLGNKSSFPQTRIDRILQQAEETITEYFNTLKQWLSDRLSSGIIFSTLRSIDKELKERILRLHYNQRGADNLVKIITQIRLLSKGYSVDPMKVL